MQYGYTALCRKSLKEICSFSPFQKSGMKTSHIYFDPALGQWRLDSLRDPGKFLLLSDKMPKAVPLGRRHWTAGSNMSVCSGGEGYKVVLTLSNCLRGMFTCDDGSCISLRCYASIFCWHYKKLV